MQCAVLFLCVALCGGVSAISVPFITRCTAEDTECLKASTQRAIPVVAAGLPELGMSPLDPMTVARVKADQAGLQMDFRDIEVKGLRNCIVIDLRRTGRKLYFDTQCSMTLIGNYTLGGRLLVLPIEGDGKFKIKIRDLLVKMVFDVENEMKDGQLHWAVGNWKYNPDVKTNVEFQFQNLFNGNKQLSDATHQFANMNWREIFQEVSPPIVKAIIFRIVDEIKKFFAGIPASKLTLD